LIDSGAGTDRFRPGIACQVALKMSNARRERFFYVLSSVCALVEKRDFFIAEKENDV